MGRKVYEYKGVTGSLKEICKKFNVNCGTVVYRLNKGMSLEEAIETQTGSLLKLCKKFNKDYSEAVDLCLSGLSEEESVSKVSKSFTYNKSFIRKKSQDYSYYKKAIKLGFKDRNDMVNYNRYVAKNGYISMKDWRCKVQEDFENKENIKVIKGEFTSSNKNISFSLFKDYYTETKGLIPLEEWYNNIKVAKFFKNIGYNGNLSFNEFLELIVNHNILSSKEVFVLKELVLGGLTLKSVGVLLGVSRQRVDQINKKALFKCKDFCCVLQTNDIKLISLGKNRKSYIYKSYTYKGVTGSLKEICKKFNVNYSTVCNRRSKGMSLEEAIETPFKNKNIYSYKDITGSLLEICKKFNVNYWVVYNRLSKGMSLEEALETPIIKKVG